MGWNHFDATARILLCGMAVILLTALAVPVLTDLGLNEGRVVRIYAAGLSALLVTLLYGMLYAGPHIRRFTRPQADEGGEVGQNPGAKNALFVLLSIFVALAVAVFLPGGTPDWLVAALGAAIVTMGQVAAFEWRIKELQEGGAE